MKKYEKNFTMLFTSEELETLFAYGPTAKREILKFDKSFTGKITKYPIVILTIYSLICFIITIFFTQLLNNF